MGSHISPSSLLRFITGLSSIPPTAATPSIKVAFHSGNNATNPLPRVVACLNTLYLPVMHKNDKDFFQHFVTALTFGMAYGSV